MSKIPLPPCDVCGHPTRGKYGVCQGSKECKRELNRRAYAANHEANLARFRRYAAENPEKIRAKRQRYYQANRDLILERGRRWIEANPEKARETQRRATRKWLQRGDRPCSHAVAGCTRFAMVGRTLCWEHSAVESAFQRSRARGGLKQRLVEKQNGICRWCYKPLPEDLAGTQIDHIIPKASGVIIEEEWNLALLHQACNGGQKRDKIGDLAIKLAKKHGIILPPCAGRATRAT